MTRIAVMQNRTFWLPRSIMSECRRSCEGIEIETWRSSSHAEAYAMVRSFGHTRMTAHKFALEARRAVRRQGSPVLFLHHSDPISL